VGTTGVIFAAIAIAWLAYLVPHFARRRDDEVVEDDPTSRFSDSVRVVRRGTAPLLNQDLAEIGTYEVSTPMTRRAAIHDLRRLERLAARRRRRVLIALLVVVTAVLAGCQLGYLPWWSLAIPIGLLAVFVVVARWSVRVLHRSLDRRYAAIRQGGDESTVLISRKGLAASNPSDVVTAPPGVLGRLWEPVPITLPTYVSKPLAPRTVRTIDLSGPPVHAGSTAMPVTADAPSARPAIEQGEREDSGEVRTALGA